ncbi:probable E3 ubiquitin-protein ligase RHC2A [Actinidia eriantha]|uniref:probable E3 ubiquitin-protein ligase RHC2A n=1 Tax=Actinidia eriantha TaxID=165200 RepID=UPI0025893683|nr:probable E3 ubiquitin-protein ligase RHC2A [Actinidia eriantha]
MSSAGSSSYWCYRCSRFIRVLSQDSIACPNCNGGFIEEIDAQTRPGPSESRRRRLPAAAMYMIGSGRNSDQGSSPVLRRSRSPFNPVIVLRGPSDAGASEEGGGRVGGFELFSDDGAGSGLRPLPASMSEFLLGSGFDRLLDQLSQIEFNGIGRVDHPPASKAAIESMPTIEIGESHIATESHCAVCKEAFELGNEVCEMPCQHIYHSDCILPWLSLRNSCPVCRHELPSDGTNSIEANRSPTEQSQQIQTGNDDETVGLTIWRLPGGGFAVGRFSGGRQGGERELPVVYTEMDGGFNNNGAPRRILWASRANVSRESGGLRQSFRNLFGCFGGIGSSASSSSSDSQRSRRSSSLSSVFSTSSRRHRNFAFDANNRTRRW